MEERKNKMTKGKNWDIKVCQLTDFDRWFSFVRLVQTDFHDVDLVNDENFRTGIIHNIKRGTAIFVEDENDKDFIIGAMIFSPSQNHIGWLAVHPNFRRQGIGSELVRYMFKALHQVREFKVKTFIEGDSSGVASRPFYQSLGFVPNEILNNEEDYSHPVQLFIKKD